MALAQLYGPPVVTDQAKFEVKFENVEEQRREGSFDGTIPLILYPNYQYQVGVVAQCYNSGTSARCMAEVDPLIVFDQAAFDAAMGNDSFALNDYYRIAFSANIVPIPSAVWLFGSGLIGALSLVRRKRIELL